MNQISWAEGIGYIASLLVFCTFYVKTMLPLRGVAIASNIRSARRLLSAFR